MFCLWLELLFLCSFGSLRAVPGTGLHTSVDALGVQLAAALAKLKAKGVKVEYLHTSGHATPGMLAKVINAVDPQDALYPMHTEKPDDFKTDLPIKESIRRIIK